MVAEDVWASRARYPHPGRGARGGRRYLAGRLQDRVRAQLPHHHEELAPRQDTAQVMPPSHWSVSVNTRLLLVIIMLPILSTYWSDYT